MKKTLNTKYLVAALPILILFGFWILSFGFIPPEAGWAVQIGGGGAAYPEKISGSLEVTSGTTFNGVYYSWPALQGYVNTYLKNNGAGTLTWETVSAGAGGSDTQVQFNSSGSLAGDSNFIWDNTNKKLGLGTLTPEAALDVQTQVTGGGNIYGARLQQAITNLGQIGSSYGLYLAPTFVGGGLFGGGIGLGVNVAGSSTGIQSTSDQGNAIYGSSNDGIGVYGYSNKSAGVYGSSNLGDAVAGYGYYGNGGHFSSYYGGYGLLVDAGNVLIGQPKFIPPPPITMESIPKLKSTLSEATQGRLQVEDTTSTDDFAGLLINQSGAMNKGTGYGVSVSKTGASTTNVGGYFSAKGATNNYDLALGTGSVLFNTVPYTWPSIQGGASTYLKNDGSGTLTWEAAGTSSDITLVKGGKIYRVMKNNSGGALKTGDVVILDISDNSGQSVKTTTTGSDPLVFGVVTTGGADQADVTVCVGGFAGDIVKVNGTNAISVGDPLSTYTAAGIAQKGTYGTGAIFAIALEAYSGADNNGVIKAWIQ